MVDHSGWVLVYRIAYRARQKQKDVGADLVSARND